MKPGKLIKTIQKENMRQSWMVALVTSGMLTFALGFIGIFSWTTTQDWSHIPQKDIAQFIIGIIFLCSAARIADKEPEK